MSVHSQCPWVLSGRGLSFHTYAFWFHISDTTMKSQAVKAGILRIRRERRTQLTIIGGWGENNKLI